MVNVSNKKAKGLRAKTRDLYKRRGPKISPNRLLKEFEVGQNVTIKINSSVHGGLPHRRFQNLSGKIVAKQGTAYVLNVMHGDKSKQVITTSAHLTNAN